MLPQKLEAPFAMCFQLHGKRTAPLFAWRKEFRRCEAARLQCGGALAFARVMIAYDRPPGAAAEVPAIAAAVSSTGAALIEIVLGFTAGE
jgi:hypothetical protein